MCVYVHMYTYIYIYPVLHLCVCILYSKKNVRSNTFHITPLRAEAPLSARQNQNQSSRKVVAWVLFYPDSQVYFGQTSGLPATNAGNLINQQFDRLRRFGGTDASLSSSRYWHQQDSTRYISSREQPWN